MKTMKHLLSLALLLFAFHACNGNDPIHNEEEEAEEPDGEILPPCDVIHGNSYKGKEIIDVIEIKNLPLRLFYVEENSIHFEGMHYDAGRDEARLSYSHKEHGSLVMPICNFPDYAKHWETIIKDDYSYENILINGTIYVTTRSHIGSDYPFLYGVLELKSLEKGDEIEEEVNADGFVEIDITPCNIESNNTFELKDVKATLCFVKNPHGESIHFGYGLIYYVDRPKYYLSTFVENRSFDCRICNLPENITEWNTKEFSGVLESEKRIILSGTVHVDRITHRPPIIYIEGVFEIKSLKINPFK